MFISDFKKSDYLYEQELAQAKIRFITVSLIILFVLLNKINIQTLYIGIGYLFVSIFTIIYLYKQKKESKLRRIIFAIVDVSALTFVMKDSNANAVIMYPALLWLIIGYGMRYGIKYLIFVLTIAEIEYSYILLTSPYWVKHQEIMYSLIFGIAGLSIFYASLVKKLHDANNILEEKIKNRTKQIKHMYLHDELTGLKNRTALSHDIPKNSYCCLILIDIDDFQNYNELYGTEIGNIVLKNFSSFLKSNIKNEYELYRLAGDKFILRQNSKKDKHSIENEIKNLLQSIKSFKIKLENINDTIDIDITIGASIEKNNSIQKAEKALKQAKKTRKQYLIYHKELDNTSYSQELLIWKNKIKEALSTNNVIPVYQAIVDKNMNIQKYESLMRIKEYQNNQPKLISPFFFLDIAKKSKLYPQLTITMIEKTFSDMKKNGNNFSINLSFDDIINKNIVTKIKEQIKIYDIAKQLTFEIVESENIDDFTYAKSFVKEFKEMGIEIAIDDFGTGYSNFTHIFELDPDFLKIDGSLIKNISTDKKSYELVSSIVHFSQALGIKTIAEFVSSKKIFEICKDLGIDNFQGYYICEPILYEELENFEHKSFEQNKLLVA